MDNNNGIDVQEHQRPRNSAHAQRPPKAPRQTKQQWELAVQHAYQRGRHGVLVAFYLGVAVGGATATLVLLVLK